MRSWLKPVLLLHGPHACYGQRLAVCQLAVASDSSPDVRAHKAAERMENHPASSQSGRRVQRKRRRCLQCGSRKFSRDAHSGQLVCQEGHVLHGYQEELAFEDGGGEEFVGPTTRKRRLRKNRGTKRDKITKRANGESSARLSPAGVGEELTQTILLSAGRYTCWLQRVPSSSTHPPIAARFSSQHLPSPAARSTRGSCDRVLDAFLTPFRTILYRVRHVCPTRRANRRPNRSGRIGHGH